jgi:1-acyl-sn-glycerol-3-phosphate acyltransferase
MNAPILPELPPQAPRVRRGLFSRLCRLVLRLSGWRLIGMLPDVPKLILIGAPHSSYWDGVWGLMIKSALGLDINIMIKKEVMDGPLGPLLRKFGLIPIDRKAAIGVVGQMLQRFNERERMWLGITPEGTRKKVDRWKSGFARIADAAQVPILPVLLDYPSKTFTLGELQHTSGDLDADVERIRGLFSEARGKHRGI